VSGEKKPSNHRVKNEVGVGGDQQLSVPELFTKDTPD